MRREEGKKIRNELFTIDGVHIAIGLRLTEDGKFLAVIDDRKFVAASLVELRGLVKPYLEQTRRLEFDPFIEVEFTASATRFSNQEDTGRHQEIEFDFTGGWLSRTTISRGSREDRRWIAAYVDPHTCAIRPLREQDRNVYGNAGDCLIPFTTERWQKLCAIAAALADVRARIAEVLADSTGAKLESLSMPKMLEGKKAK